MTVTMPTISTIPSARPPQPTPSFWAIVALDVPNKDGDRNAWYIQKSPDAVDRDLLVEHSTDADGDDMRWAKDQPAGVYRITMNPLSGEDWFDLNVVKVEPLYSVEPAPLTEADNFIVEAAMQYGFEPADNDDDLYVASSRQIVALVKAAREQGRQDVLSLQPRCVTWLDKVTEDDPTDLIERLARFFEESAEFVQSKGFTEAQAHDIVRYVFGRPAGDPPQEIGGAFTTLAVLCDFIGEDVFACAEAELARVDTPEMIQKIREKRSRRHGRGVLPGTTEEADLVPAAREEPYRAPFIGLPLSDGRMI